MRVLCSILLANSSPQYKRSKISLLTRKFSKQPPKPSWHFFLTYHFVCLFDFQLEVHEAKAMMVNHPQWDIPETEEEEEDQEDSDGIEESEEDDED